MLNGGILATLVDCHCMGTALAHAYRLENRPMGSQPVYRYATAKITVRYLLPTRNDLPVTLRAQIVDTKGRWARLVCHAFSDGRKTAEAEVEGIRVLEGEPEADSLFR